MASTTPVEGPLYAYTLPSGLLDHLEQRDGASTATASDESKDLHSSRPSDQEVSTSLGCSLCKVPSFHSVANQRQHFKSDWHKYNLHLSTAKRTAAPLTEEQFDAQAEADDLGNSSISGSDASSSRSSSSSSSSTHASAEGDQLLSSRKTPLAWFIAPGYESQTQFGLYRSIVPSILPKTHVPPEGWQNALKALQVNPALPLNKKQKEAAGQESVSVAGGPVTPPNVRTMAVFMVGAGHFAAAVISLVPRIVKQSGKLERELDVLAHKTVHRYTTRRKQGGSQSANDQSKAKAKSAGAQIRRYNEQALQDDIRALLSDWKEMLRNTDLIFMRTSKVNSKIFFNYDEAVIQRSDPRIRTIPFPTRRPTMAEVHRVFQELTRVKVSHLSDEALAKLDEAYLAEQMARKARLAKPVMPKKQDRPAAQEKQPQMSEEELTLRKRWLRVTDMVVKGRIDALISFVGKREEDMPVVDFTGALPDWLPEAELSPTLLHLASYNGQPEIVRWLLLDLKADPTTQNRNKKTPYETAATKATRNVFRRCMNDHPAMWDWQGAARVPSALTEETEQDQKDKNKERKSKLRERARERDAAAKAEEDQRQQREAAAASARAEEARQKMLNTPSKGPSRLGGPASGLLRAREAQQTAGLSEQDKMRVERERRARAAEARLSGRS